MKKLILLFSHELTKEQREDAKITLGIEVFVPLDDALQKIWSNVPPSLERLSQYVEPLKAYLDQEAKKGDFVLVQGDFGATHEMVEFSKSCGLIPVYATTKRNVVEQERDGKIVKTSVFEHVRFREFR